MPLVREAGLRRGEPSLSNEARALALSTVAWLEARAIPPTPEDYRVAFAHLAGEDPAPSAALAESERDDARPDAVQLRSSHERFVERAEACAPVGHGRQLEELAGRLQRELVAAGEETRRYGSSLPSVRAVEARPRDSARVAELLHRIADATAWMQEPAQRLRGGLASGAAEIGEPSRSWPTARRAASADASTGLAAEPVAERPATAFAAAIDPVEAGDDRSGRRQGGRVPTRVAEALRDRSEGRDPAARYGGEGSALLLADTPLSTGLERAGRLGATRALRHRPARDGTSSGPITPSLEPGEPQPAEPIAQRVARADRAGSAAKRADRERAAAPTASEP
jgi:diguanylate cyclase